MAYPYNSPNGPESAHTVSTSDGYCDRMTIKNVSSSIRYAFIYKGTIATGQRVEGPITLPPNAIATVRFTNERRTLGLKHPNGIAVGSSSASWPYTAAGGTDFIVDAEGG